jgi:riboflavin synthase
MFTGIVEELGTILSIEPQGSGVRARIGATTVLEGAALGDSTAVDGCCLTVVELGDGWFEADVSDESLRRTTLGGRTAGDRVNLERPLLVTDRLGGHIVQGHVDGVGEVVAIDPGSDGGALLRVRVPDELLRYAIHKGSITIDGVSLTVATLHEDGVTIALIPHTLTVTTLGVAAVGDPVNLEMDMIAKYVERLMERS